MPLRLPIGISDFRELREKNLEYIDKYGAELIAAGAEPVHVLVVAFDGKEVRVRRVEAEDES